MKEILTIRIWQGLTGLLVLCNFCLLAVLWFKPCPKPMPPIPTLPMNESPRDFVINEMKFNKRFK